MSDVDHTDRATSELPDIVTLEGKLPSSAKPAHIATGSSIYSTVSFAPTAPKLRPNPGGGVTPLTSAEEVEAVVISPDPGDCAPTVRVLYSSAEFRITVSGADSQNACAAWAEAVARDGLDATLSNVPWNNVVSGDERRVTVKLSVH